MRPLVVALAFALPLTGVQNYELVALRSLARQRIATTSKHQVKVQASVVMMMIDRVLTVTQTDKGAWYWRSLRLEQPTDGFFCARLLIHNR